MQIEHHQNPSPKLQVIQGKQALLTMCEICLELLVQLSDMFYSGSEIGAGVYSKWAKNESCKRREWANLNLQRLLKGMSTLKAGLKSFCALSRELLAM